MTTRGSDAGNTTAAVLSSSSPPPVTDPAITRLSHAAVALFASPEQLLTSTYLQQRKRWYTDNAWYSLLHSLSLSHTLYIGNLAFTTREEQMREFFGYSGRVRRLVMGLNKQTLTPCGFAFVEYHCHDDTAHAKHWLSGARLDGRPVEADFDQAFTDGRQYGRSASGGQIRDDHRSKFDKGRGGLSENAMKRMRDEMAARQVSTFGTMTGVSVSDDSSGVNGGNQQHQRFSYKDARAARTAAGEPAAKRTRVDGYQNLAAMEEEVAEDSFPVPLADNETVVDTGYGYSDDEEQ